MNEQIRELVRESGGEFWQRIESDGVLNKEAYITFDPPQSLEKFAKLIVRECAHLVGGYTKENEFGTDVKEAYEEITKHFGVE